MSDDPEVVHGVVVGYDGNGVMIVRLHPDDQCPAIGLNLVCEVLPVPKRRTREVRASKVRPGMTVLDPTDRTQAARVIEVRLHAGGGVVIVADGWSFSTDTRTRLSVAADK